MTGNGEDYIMRSLLVCTPQQILFGCMWHVWKTRESHAGLWWGNLRKRDHLEDSEIDETIILKRILKKWEGACTEMIWPRIGKSGAL
jgi:hypothetical protein